MLEVKAVCTLVLLFYTFIIFIQLLAKSFVNSKHAFSFDLFNHVLIIFMLFLISKVICLYCLDLDNLYAFKNILMLKSYIFLMFYFVYILSVYICRNAFHCHLVLKPKQNLLSYYYMAIFFVFTILIYALPIEITIIDNTFNVGGLSFLMCNIGCLFSYVIVIYEFFKNIKSIDPFQAFGPMLLPMCIFIGLYLKYFYGFSSFEIILALVLVIIYFGVEKREEKFQKELISTTLALEKASRFKSDFLSSMSHEIKTPLNSILASSRNLINKENVNFAIKNSINDIVYASDVLKETVSNILTISKIEINKLSISNITFNPREQIKTLPFIEKMNLDSSGISFFISFDDNVPKLLYGCDSLIRIIMDNTLTYAQAHISGGTLSLKVSWYEHEEGCKLIISIENLEANTPDLYRDIENLSVDIYDSYNNESFGLGVANLLCQKLEGTVFHEHEEGRNIITFEIPFEKYNSNIDFDSITYEGKRALVVDDVELNLKVASRVLSQLKLQGEYVNSGADALEIVKNSNFDIIFLDIMMPNMSGEETLQKLKEIEGFNTPVIALTADDAGGAREKYKSLGFDGLVIKPFSKIDLINELEDILGGDK